MNSRIISNNDSNRFKIDVDTIIQNFNKSSFFEVHYQPILGLGGTIIYTALIIWG